MTPHSKSEAKRLAATSPATFWPTCECATGTAPLDEPGVGSFCPCCGSAYVRVPNVVEDKIRASERAKSIGDLNADIASLLLVRDAAEALIEQLDRSRDLSPSDFGAWRVALEDAIAAYNDGR